MRYFQVFSQGNQTLLNIFQFTYANNSVGETILFVSLFGKCINQKLWNFCCAHWNAWRVLDMFLSIYQLWEKYFAELLLWSVFERDAKINCKLIILINSLILSKESQTLSDPPALRLYDRLGTLRLSLFAWLCAIASSIIS